MSGETYQSLNDAPAGTYRYDTGRTWVRRERGHGVTLARLDGYRHLDESRIAESDPWGPFSLIAPLTVPK